MTALPWVLLIWEHCKVEEVVARAWMILNVWKRDRYEIEIISPGLYLRLMHFGLRPIHLLLCFFSGRGVAYGEFLFLFCTTLFFCTFGRIVK